MFLGGVYWCLMVELGIVWELVVSGRDTWSDVDVWCRLVTDIGQLIE